VEAIRIILSRRRHSAELLTVDSTIITVSNSHRVLTRTIFMQAALQGTERTPLLLLALAKVYRCRARQVSRSTVTCVQVSRNQLRMALHAINLQTLELRPTHRTRSSSTDLSIRSTRSAQLCLMQGAPWQVTYRCPDKNSEYLTLTSDRTPKSYLHK
jgi:hypothetical protein